MRDEILRFYQQSEVRTRVNIKTVECAVGALQGVADGKKLREFGEVNEAARQACLKRVYNLIGAANCGHAVAIGLREGWLK